MGMAKIKIYRFNSFEIIKQNCQIVPRQVVMQKVGQAELAAPIWLWPVVPFHEEVGLVNWASGRSMNNGHARYHLQV